MKKKFMALLSIILCFSLITAVPALARDNRSATNVNNKIVVCSNLSGNQTIANMSAGTLKTSIADYEGFSGAPDFGEYFNVEYSSKTMTMNHIIDTYRYTIKDLPANFVYIYGEILKEKGFPCTGYYVSIKEGSQIWNYMNDKSFVTISIIVNDTNVTVAICKRR